jgi:hypothetical protein
MPTDNDARTPRANDARTARAYDARTPRANDARTPRANDARTPRANDARTPRANDARTPRANDARMPRANVSHARSAGDAASRAKHQSFGHRAAEGRRQSECTSSLVDIAVNCSVRMCARVHLSSTAARHERWRKCVVFCECVHAHMGVSVSFACARISYTREYYLCNVHHTTQRDHPHTAYLCACMAHTSSTQSSGWCICRDTCANLCMCFIRCSVCTYVCVRFSTWHRGGMHKSRILLHFIVCGTHARSGWPSTTS